jgi:hypothetical protein
MATEDAGRAAGAPVAVADPGAAAVPDPGAAAVPDPAAPAPASAAAPAQAQPTPSTRDSDDALDLGAAVLPVLAKTYWKQAVGALVAVGVIVWIVTR